MAWWWLNQNDEDSDYWDEELVVVPRRDKLGRTAPGYAASADMAPGDLGFAFLGGDLQAVFAVMEKSEEEAVPMGEEDKRRAARIVPCRFHDLFEPISFETLTTALRALLPLTDSPLDPESDRKETRVFPIGDVLIERLRRMVADGEPMGGALAEAMCSALAASDMDDDTLAALNAARIGSGPFRDNTLALWDGACAVSGSRIAELVQVATIKAWTESTNEERLDGENGLPLLPTWLFAFGQGLVSFADDGAVMLSESLTVDEARQAGLDPAARVAIKGERQRAFLAWHRDNVFGR